LFPGTGSRAKEKSGRFYDFTAFFGCAIGEEFLVLLESGRRVLLPGIRRSGSRRNFFLKLSCDWLKTQ